MIIMKNSRKLFYTSLAVSLLAFALAGPAHSESGPDYGKTGPYVGLGFAMGFENFSGLGIGDFVSFDPAYGFDAWGGYRFHPNFSTELQLEYLNGYHTDVFAPLSASGQSVTFTGNLKYYILTGRIQPFLLAGVGLGWQSFDLNGVGNLESASGLAGRLGGGLDFYLTENIALQASTSYVFVRYGLNLLGQQGDYVSLNLGAQFRF